MPLPRRLPVLLLAVLLALGLGAPAVGAAPAAAAPGPSRASGAPGTDDVVLARAQALAEGRPGTPARDASQVQRDLLGVAGDRDADPASRARARALLARPTDGLRDLVGGGYRAPARRTCSVHVCVHFVTTTRDAPPDQAWVRRTLAVVERVWRAEVGRLGYRRPLPDGTRGGDSRFDVYLQDLGAFGAYGYCTPEGPGAARRTGTSPGYCVLDDDFSPAQFGGVRAVRSLKVTAAHEFFHAVQLAYTVGADPWFAESTAVWMEGRVFGGIDDNRQYLPFGQLDRPGGSLDRFQPAGFAQYGNWVVWQRLTDRFGTGLVRRIWERVARGPYAARALQQELAGRRGGLPAALADVGSALADAPEAFREGAAWPAAKPPREVVVGAASPRAVLRTRLDHLATGSFRLVPQPPGAAGASAAPRLVLRVRGPRDARTAPGAHVRITRAGGRVTQRTVVLDRRGRARTSVPFGAGRVASVTVTVANASTRFACGRGTLLSCRGVPLDDGARFRVVARLGS